MHEEKIALVDGQVKAVQQAVAARAVENVYFVACGGSLATLYPGKYILERETAAVSTGISSTVHSRSVVMASVCSWVRGSFMGAAPSAERWVCTSLCCPGGRGDAAHFKA
mgnify:CR=1 FL=1